MGKRVRHLDLFPMSVRVNMAEILLKRYQTTFISHFSEPDMVLYLKRDGTEWLINFDKPLDQKLCYSTHWVYARFHTANRKTDMTIEYCLNKIDHIIATAFKNQ